MVGELDGIYATFIANVDDVYKDISDTHYCYEITDALADMLRRARL